MDLGGNERIVLERVHQLGAMGEPATLLSITAELDRQIGQTGFTYLEGEPSVLVALERLEALGLVATNDDGVSEPVRSAATWRLTEAGHERLQR